jgi:hypothetical protein
MRAFVRSPSASTTITSPASASAMALWIIRLSPGRVFTVSAGPASTAPGACIGRRRAPPAVMRDMTSLTFATGSERKRSTSAGSARRARRRMRKPDAKASSRRLAPLVRHFVDRAAPPVPERPRENATRFRNRRPGRGSASIKQPPLAHSMLRRAASWWPMRGSGPCGAFRPGPSHWRPSLLAPGGPPTSLSGANGHSLFTTESGTGTILKAILAVPGQPLSSHAGDGRRT